MNRLSKDIYLDACSTSPPLAEVTDEISTISSQIWGNPSSVHNVGILSARILEKSRNVIADKFNVEPTQIVFTSGATESISLALSYLAYSSSPGRVIISSVEHPAGVLAVELLRRLGWEVVLWPVDKYGVIDLNYIDQMLSSNTKIVSIIWGQSEIGTLQPISTIAKECKERNIYFHTDATQILSQGIFDFLDVGANALSASAHKFRGPKGIGFLVLDKYYLKKFIDQQKHIHQENGLRAGTQSVALIHGMSIALDRIKTKISINKGNTCFEPSNTSINTKLLLNNLLQINGLSLLGHPTHRLPNHISLLVTKNNRPLPSRKIVYELSKIGIYTSSGTACNSLSQEKNYVLASIGLKPEMQKSNLRISLGNWIDTINTPLIANIIEETINKIYYQTLNE